MLWAPSMRFQFPLLRGGIARDTDRLVGVAADGPNLALQRPVHCTIDTFEGMGPERKPERRIERPLGFFRCVQAGIEHRIEPSVTCGNLLFREPPYSRPIVDSELSNGLRVTTGLLRVPLLAV